MNYQALHQSFVSNVVLFDMRELCSSYIFYTKYIHYNYTRGIHWMCRLITAANSVKISNHLARYTRTIERKGVIWILKLSIAITSYWHENKEKDRQTRTLHGYGDLRTGIRCIDRDLRILLVCTIYAVQIDIYIFCICACMHWTDICFRSPLLQLVR